VSVKCGERVLLPAVRQAGGDELIVADGFSCREQIAQCTDRAPLHLAQVIQLAKRDGAAGPGGGGPPEAAIVRARRRERRRAALEAAAYLTAGAALGAAVYRTLRERGRRTAGLLRYS
jgi:hypothetical protein